jgi:hypothetical protein
MESKDLGAGKIVTSLKTLGEVHVQQTLVVDDLVSAPAVCGRVVAMVEDLEPAITSSLVGASVGNLLQVNGTRTLVATVKALLARVVGP